MIDPLATWQSTLAALPKVADTSWAQNFANWYAARIAAIQPDPAALVATGFVFVFPTAVFAAALAALQPTEDQEAGVTSFADAWKSAMSGIVFPAGISAAPGTFKPPTSPTTLFSAVNSVVLRPDSIDAGHAKIVELKNAPPTDDALTSQFPQYFRDATLLLKITVVGLDSQPPPTAGPGPQPLTVDNVPLL